MKLQDRLEQAGILLTHCSNVREVETAVEKILDSHADRLPASVDASIFLKPNLNNDMCALTGGTTDLRLLVAIIRVLKKRGYTDITIGDGPNTGAYYNQVDVLERLRVRSVARHFGVHVVDLNHAPYVEVQLTTNRARVARICLESDFMINLPKIKTHSEAHVTVSCKSLVGCFMGLDKRKIHSRLFPNIVRMNEIIRPDLHIVDGLVVMEGQGPSTGTPRKMGVILGGTEPFLLDAVVCQLIGIDPDTVPYLEIAVRKGLLNATIMESLKPIEPLAPITPAHSNPLVNLMLSNSFIIPRYWKALRWIADSEIVGRLLLALKIRQDDFLSQNAVIQRLSINRELADKRCEDYCPMGLPILSENFDFQNSDCIKCLYCFMVSPPGAIQVEGDLGYLSPHLTKYKPYMEEL